MRKLVIFCFAVCMTVLSALSLFNFAQEAEESMIWAVWTSATAAMLWDMPCLQAAKK